MSPPVEVPAAVVLPALSTIAASLLSVVAMFCETVRSPLCVATETMPVALMPLVEPIVPTFSAVLLVNRTVPVLATNVTTSLAGLLSV